MRIATLSAVTLLTLPAPCHESLAAQEAAPVPDPVTLPHTEVFDVHSEHADADFQIWVAQPVAGMRPFPPGPRRVLYVLDANLFFGTAVEMTRIMSQLYGELPPLLVVGIGYDTTDPALQAELRGRDFTPTVDAGFQAMSLSIPGAPEPTLPEGRRLGGAAEFLRFVTEEVQPFVENRYDVAEEGSILFGSSLGGLFTLYAMLERPEAFDAYIAVSPALWWDDGALLESARAFRPPARLHRSLFLSVGSEEEREDVPALASFKLVSNVRTLADELGAEDDSGLRLRAFIGEGESHTTVVPVALTRGLRWLVQTERAAAYRNDQLKS